MDFSSLPRRELQALCKRNKIPANLTNVAMIDSLKALDTVEGINEVLQACKSEIAQSSIEPPSPYVTPAPLGAASRRRRVAKGDSAVTQIGGTRRSARLAEKSARLSKGVGNRNTDVLKKDLFIADGQEVKINLEESLDSLSEMSGVTDMEVNSERQDEGHVDSANKRDVSTDVKPVQTIEEVNEKSVELLEQVDEISDFLKKDLANDDGLVVVLKEIPDNLVNITGDSGLCENSEGNDEPQVDSYEKLEMSIGEERNGKPQVDSSEKQEMLIDEERNGEPQVVSSENQNMSVDEGHGKPQVDSSEEQEMSIDEERYGKPHVDLSDKHGMSIDEDVKPIEEQMNNIFENDGVLSKLKDDYRIETKEQGDDEERSDKHEMSIDEDVDPIIEEQINNISENDGVISKLKDDYRIETEKQGDDSKVDKVEKESLSDAVDVKTELNETRDAEVEEGFGSEINVESGNKDCEEAVSLDEFVTDDDVFSDDDETSNDEDSDPDENVEDSELDTDSSETESGSDESDSITLDLTDESKSTKNKDSSDCMPSEISSMSYEDLSIEEETESDVTTIHGVSDTDAPLSDEAKDELNKSPTHQVAAPAPKNITTPIVINKLPLIFTESDEPIVSTPKGASANKVYFRRARMAAASNNKENVSSGSKTAPAKMRSKFIKEIAETAPMLDDHNLKKLAEDMKELHITQKLDKNEGANEVPARTALQVLPGNRKPE